MLKEVEAVVRDVKVALDLNTTDESLASEGDEETLTLEAIIRSKIERGVRKAHMEAPVYQLEEGHNFGEDLHWGDQGSGWVLLPDDFMRLIVYEMSDWDRPVYTAITPEDAGYAMQRGRIKGLRGSAQRPVCAIVMRPEGRALEFYSSRSEEAQVRKAMYVPEPRIDRYGRIDISERCYEEAVEAIAALVRETINGTT